MSIIRFDPFADLLTNGRWVPAVDIFENGKQELVLKAELPDMKREDIQVVFENNTLTLKGERKFEGDVKQEQFHRVERAYGTFSRSFSLPSTVDATTIAAEYKNGVLTVTLPFREEAQAADDQRRSSGVRYAVRQIGPVGYPAGPFVISLIRKFLVPSYRRSTTTLKSGRSHWTRFCFTSSIATRSALTTLTAAAAPRPGRGAAGRRGATAWRAARPRRHRESGSRSAAPSGE